MVAAFGFGASSAAVPKCPPPGKNATRLKATALSIQATPDPVTAGDPVVISGRLQGLARGAPRCGIRVELWQRLPGQHGFHAVTATTTDRSGRYQFPLSAGAVETNSEWATTAPGLRSTTFQEQVRALVTLSSSATFAVAGDRETLSGMVAPGHQGQRILVQRLSAGNWQTMAQPRLSRTSTFAVIHRFSSSGREQWRALLPPNRRNIESPSPVVRIRVAPLTGIHKIRHVVIIMQENRSFDSYFGTYPGADGIPPGVCVPDPVNGGCIPPFHDPADLNYGGPHGAAAYAADSDGALMDGFVGQAETGMGCSTTNPNCSPCNNQSSTGQSTRCVDVMGYHDAREIPNYWSYAQNFVLQDHMFEPNSSWSLPAHLFELSEWSAFCANPLDAFSCHGALESPNPDYTGGINGPSDGQLHYAWTDMTYLLHSQNVSWGYYVFKGTEPDCENDNSVSCAPIQQGPQTPGIWNPLPSFTDVAQDGQLGNIQSLSSFFAQSANGTLPAVSWIDPNGAVSEHPPGLVSAGQTYVTGLINHIMSGPDWNSTAIFLSWDDWGGFYDHVLPPAVDRNGFGFRVPGLLISAYARTGVIDHQILSHDAYNKFIEDDFLGGLRLDPATDGRPDPRPDVRESNPILGDLTAEFNFNQTPRPQLILPVHPAPGPASTSP